jgi:hypothetical protein
VRCVGNQHHGGDEGRLERLLDGQLQNQVDKVAAQKFVVPIVGKQVGDAGHLFVPGAHGVFGDGDQLLAHAHVWRGSVEAATAAAAAIVAVVII